MLLRHFGPGDRFPSVFFIIYLKAWNYRRVKNSSIWQFYAYCARNAGTFVLFAPVQIICRVKIGVFVSHFDCRLSLCFVAPQWKPMNLIHYFLKVIFFTLFFLSIQCIVRIYYCRHRKSKQIHSHLNRWKQSEKTKKIETEERKSQPKNHRLMNYVKCNQRAKRQQFPMCVLCFCDLVRKSN